jgi:hypothetical protein
MTTITKSEEAEFDKAWEEKVEGGKADDLSAAGPETDPEPKTEQEHKPEPKQEPEPSSASKPEPEPAKGQETAPAEKPAPGVEDLETLRKKAATADSMLGRLEAERRRNAELAKELEAFKAKEQARQQAAPIDVRLKLDQEMAALVEGLSKENPECAKLALEDSKDGARIRRILSEYGTDIAATQAEIILDHRGKAAQEQTVAATAKKAAEEQHYAKLAEDHPEFGEVLRNRDPEKVAAMQKDIAAWINTLPYGEGSRYAEVLLKGNTAQVSEVLGKFKLFALAQLETQRTKAEDTKREQAAAAAGFAVPSKPRAVPKQQPNEDDFDSAFDEE